MLENLINVDRFNITFVRYLLLYAVCGYFLRLSLWVDVILFCSRFGVCNLAQGVARISRKTCPHLSKKKNKVEVAQNLPLKNSDFRASPPNRAKGRCVDDGA